MAGIAYAPGVTVAQALTQAIVAVGSNGDNVLVAAPGAGKRLAVATLKGRRTAGSSVTTIVTIKNGATGVDYTEFSDANPKETFWDASATVQMRLLAANVALVANHSAANPITYVVRYLILDA